MKRFFNVLFCALCLGLVLSWATLSNSQELTSLDEVEASQFAQDYKWQGEYITPSDGRAYQVIADGDGEFRIVGYPGGLPGDGWERSMARFYGTGTLNGNKMTIVGERMHLPAKEEPNLIFDEKMKSRPMYLEKTDSGYIFFNKEEREAVKVLRVSPTFDLEAPEDAVVIFDGTNVDQFLEGARLNEEGESLWAEAASKPFPEGAYLMHMEFMTSFMPTARGQARSNSGVYIAQAYECQVLDSFGLEGENDECGGFYKSEKPIVNMAFPPLTWQTYDIFFTPPKYDGDKKVENARFTVLHNGILIQDDIELPAETPGCLKEENEARGVYLQGHGNKVQYRNIWVLPLNDSE